MKRPSGGAGSHPARLQQIRESIETLLTAPIGGLPFRPEQGFAVLAEDGLPKPGLTADFVQEAARTSLIRGEPRIAVETITPEFVSDRLQLLRISYKDVESGLRLQTVVYFRGVP